MKLLLTTVLILAFFTFAGCGDTSNPTPKTPAAESHNKNDGHDHGADAGHKKEAESEDHSGHDH